MIALRHLSVALLVSLSLAACAQHRTPASPAQTPPVASPPEHATPTAAYVRPDSHAPKGIDFPGVHNVVGFSDVVYSGSAPEGVEGLASLKALGFRTILSVDGSAPDALGASKLGMRYVHLPISYGGIEEERKLEIARVVRDLPGPVYIHCHHGKHRSAGAAAAAVVGLGQVDNATAHARMKAAGTSADYTGLYACAIDTVPMNPATIDKASNEFPARWKNTGMVDAMVAIDLASDDLKAIEKAGWKVPANHPDLVPTAVAGNLESLLRTLLDDHEAKAKPAEFQELLKASAEAARKLEYGISGQTAGEELGKLMKTVAQSCKDCHSKYRD